jgi:iron complex outermembrane receptor protein
MKRSTMKLSNDARFRLAVHAALLAGVSTAVSAPVYAQDAPATEEGAAELDTVTVTGTRLSRAALEGALPVTVITREQIDLSGDISVADFLRDLSLNSFGSFRQQSGSSAQGLASLSLRGLGSDRTLILIDGKRAPKAPYAPSAQDLNAIPLGAIERIEILQDGASAIYGSDAIAGVVNIILRKDYQGTQMMYGRGYSAVGGGDTSQLGFVMGMPTASGNIVMGASYNTRDIVFARDLLAEGIGTPGSSKYGNNYVTPVDNFVTRSAVPGGCDSSSAFIVVTAPISLDLDMDGVAETSKSAYDYDGDGQNDFCQYDFTRVSADEASTENMALFAKGRFGINTDWSVYSTASISRATSFGRYAPAPALLFVPGSASGIDHDGDTVDDDVYVYHRYDALGNRDNNIEGTVYDLLAGFDGRVAGFQVDFGGRFNEYKSFDVGRNYVVNSLASASATAGDYNFADPAANTPAVLNAMKATIARESTWSAQDYWANASTDLFAMPGGTSQLAFGVDYYTARYYDQYDSLSEGNQIGGSAGNSSGANRAVTGYFVEAYLPIMDRLDATIALRMDDYDDLQDTELSPKLALSYQPMDTVKVRASYGEGFRAPTLDVISQLPSFSAEDVQNDEPTCLALGETWDGSQCSAATQINTTFIANPDLSPEDSEQYSFGVVLQPVDFIDVAIDYYSYDVNDVISTFTTEDLVDFENRGIAIPAGLSLTRADNDLDGVPDPDGELVSAVAGYGNYGTLTTSGFNIDGTLRWNFGEMGNLKTNLQLAWVTEYEFSDDGVDQVGLIGVPEYRWNWNTDYRWQQLGFAWNQTYIEGNGSVDDSVWWTHDLQATYDMPFNAGMLTVGVLNVTDEQPPAYSYDGRPYNFYLYNAYGQTPYVRYTLRFQ